jgi:hypothetical protein
MNVGDKIKQSVKHKPRPRLRRRVRKSELWSRAERQAMSALAEQYLKDKRDAQEQT